MANHTFRPPLGCLEVDVVSLYCKFVVGATGAVGTVTGKGITSVTKDSTGQYSILLDGTYNAFLWGAAGIMTTTSSDPATVGVLARLEAETVATTKLVQLQFYALDDGAVADPFETAVVYIKLELRNSSVS